MKFPVWLNTVDALLAKRELSVDTLPKGIPWKTWSERLTPKQAVARALFGLQFPFAKLEWCSKTHRARVL